MLNKGYELVECNSPKDIIESDKVGYCFSHHDENTLAWVIDGYAEIGATDNETYNIFSRTKKNELVVLYRTKSLLRNIVSIRNNLPQEIIKTIKESFLKMNESETGKEALSSSLLTDKFELLDSLNYIKLKKDFQKYIFN